MTPPSYTVISAVFRVLDSIKYWGGRPSVSGSLREHRPHTTHNRPKLRIAASTSNEAGIFGEQAPPTRAARLTVLRPTFLTSVGSTSDVKKNATDNAPPIATFPSTAKPIRLASERMGLVDWSVFDTSRLHTRKHPPNISKREMANLRPCMFAIYTLEKVAGISNKRQDKVHCSISSHVVSQSVRHSKIC